MPYAIKGGSTNGCAACVARLTDQIRPSVTVTRAVFPSSTSTASSKCGRVEGKRSTPVANSAERSTAAIACAVAGSKVTASAIVISERGAAVTHHTAISTIRPATIHLFIVHARKNGPVRVKRRSNRNRTEAPCRPFLTRLFEDGPTENL